MIGLERAPNKRRPEIRFQKWMDKFKRSIALILSGLILIKGTPEIK